MNINFVINRDNCMVAFDQSKVVTSINNALKSVHPDQELSAVELEMVNSLVAEVITKLSEAEETCPNVETIQDQIESVLVAHNMPDAAKNFMMYRKQRTDVGIYHEDLNKTYCGIIADAAAEVDLTSDNVDLESNAPMGLMLRFGSEGVKDFVKRYVLKPEHSIAHISGAIHVHDLDFYLLTINNCQIDLGDLLKRGFSTGHGFLREPQSILSAAALCCISLQSNQNDMHGSQSIPKFEYDLAPYVVKSYSKYLCEVVRIRIAENDLDLSGLREKIDVCFQRNGSVLSPASQDDIGAWVRSVLSTKFRGQELDENADFVLSEAWNLTKAETNQAMEALIHNLNTMQTGAGAKVPFSVVNYGTGTTPEQRMIIEGMLFATNVGLGCGDGAKFPIQVFKVKDGVNAKPSDPNYDLLVSACMVCAKRMSPCFAFLDAPFSLRYYQPGQPDTELAVAGDGARLLVNEYDRTKQVVSGRGNLFVTSINFPRLAIDAHGSIEKFYNMLDFNFNLACEQLLDRFEIIAAKRVYNYPFLMGQGVWADSSRLHWDDQIRDVIKNGSLSVGFVGLAETLIALVGQHHGESDLAWDLGLEIIRHMRELVDAETKMTGLNFTLFAIQDEDMACRLIKLDCQRYGKLKGITDHVSYTNSFHIPDSCDISVAQRIRREGPFHELCNGGAITTITMDGDLTKNQPAMMSLVSYMRQCGVGLCKINYLPDRCPVCGCVGIINDNCPKCGRKDGEGVSIKCLRAIGVDCINRG